MRKIKFRVWDGKRMTTSGIMFNTSSGYLEVPTIGSFGGELTIPYELMQFTGLKDKNGVEIYEGDIYNAHSCTYQILFVNGAFCGGKNLYSCAPIGWSPEQDENFEHEKDFTGELIVDNDFVKIIQVIGNIYQNPELLK